MPSQGQILSAKATGIEKAAIFYDAIKQASEANHNLADVAGQILQPGTKVLANVPGHEQPVHADVVLCIASHQLVALNLLDMRMSKVTVSIDAITAIL